MTRTGTPSEVDGVDTQEADNNSGGIRSLRERIRRLPGGWVGWRIGVTLVGVAIIVVGAILLPLPGPGWLIIFAGLGVLATEYEWASRLLGFAKEQVKRWTRWIGAQPLWLRAVFGLLLTAFVVAVAWVAWQVYG